MEIQNGDFLRLGPTHCAMVVQFIRHDTRGLIDAIVELASRFLYFHWQVGTSQAARWYARRDVDNGNTVGHSHAK
jgi:hypothetical protein